MFTHTDTLIHLCNTDQEKKRKIIDIFYVCVGFACNYIFITYLLHIQIFIFIHK